MVKHQKNKLITDLDGNSAGLCSRTEVQEPLIVKDPPPPYTRPTIPTPEQFVFEQNNRPYVPQPTRVSFIDELVEETTVDSPIKCASEEVFAYK